MMILENKYDKLFHKKIVFVAECFAVEKKSKSKYHYYIFSRTKLLTVSRCTPNILPMAE